MIQSIRSGDFLTAKIFGKEQRLQVFCTGDNQFDEDGNYKEEGFGLLPEEVRCLNWLLDNVDLNDYRDEILAYCNGCYSMIGDKQIGLGELEDEVGITAIAVNISKITQSGDGSLIYPEISFLGECRCEPEHGICIGFRDRKFLGIDVQAWTL